MEAYQRNYLTAKIATDMYKLNPEWLSSMQRVKVDEQVERLFRVQKAILGSSEANFVTVSAQDIQTAFDKLAEGYQSYNEFKAAMKGQHLTEGQLKQVLSEELKCEKVMDLVSQDIPELDQATALEYFNTHLQEFSRSNVWELSQILITVNDEFSENHRDEAWRRIHDVKKQCDFTAFGTLAMKYSECPSAMSNGYLGWCEETKLYPQIAACLFELKHGEVSEVIETDLGFHLVRVHQYKGARTATFEEAYPFLQRKHEQRARAFLQKQWISQLLHSASLCR
ncbi:peptidylprolyl isomerase [Vibrio diazotrophicus]|uniref:peptidylprolyl isomerase n=1 Tax=Vibrio diazotrophicus TaxID=685 RepID=UPI0022AFA422|nr:peptidylprolyl isomerase [Vibrio diazotrophicus]MCZ4370550.1 peptidylprolyl isomerase [Vibrio diazotrophicus]